MMRNKLETRNSKRFSVTFACFLVFLSFSSVAVALPLYSDSECKKTFNVPSGWLTSSPKALYYYVKSDFAEKLRTCSPDPDDDAVIEQHHATAVVKQAAEIWNLQARGLPLIYRGWTSQSESDFCANQSIDEPAIYIDFREGCLLPSSCQGPFCDDTDCLDSVGSIRKIPDCNKAVRVTIWGDKTTLNSCSSDARNFRLNSILASNFNNPQQRSLIRVMTHELGHALNLGHPEGTIYDNGHSVMSPTNRWDPGRHLFYWEKDCVDDPGVSGGRSVRHHYKSFALNNWSSISNHYYPTNRGHWSGHFWWSGVPAALTYALYASPYVEYGLANEFYGYPSYASLPSMLTNLDTIPVFTAQGTPTQYSYQRIIYTWANSLTNIYPPEVRYHRSDDFFENWGWGQFHRCTNTSCSSHAQVFSNFPLSTAYDPHTGTDIFVRLHNTGARLGGNIMVHPGLSSTWRVNHGSYLSVLNTNMPETGSTPVKEFWSYTGRTDALPGVACAPNRETFAYNCLLAWVDRGAPTGRVLYTYFRIVNGTVEWHGEAWARGGSLTVGPVSAAYAHGRFWMAWKSWHNPSKLTTTYTSNSYTGWSTVEETNRSMMVDPPSFQAVLSNPMVLVWTESN
ncbi:MAG: hypothetical protein ACNA8W_07875 [Bradymonadaceae bacterium]